MIALTTLAACARPAEPRHAVLITIDTLRADHVGRQIDSMAITPTISELAARSVEFSAASSVASETSPAIAALFTGLLPNRTGVLGNRHTLPAEPPTLATTLRENGFRTVAIVANPVLDARYGFARGFDRFTLVAPGPGEVKARAADVAREVERQLAELAGTRRLFLWLHYFDPHGPYRPPPARVASLRLEAFGERSLLELCPRGQNGGRNCVPWYQQDPASPSRDGRSYLRAYAGEVAEVDAEIGAALRSPGLRALLDDGALVLTADHGEALHGDHRYYFSHGSLLTEDQIAVPLLFRADGLAARRDESPASLVDVAPTLLSILGLPPLEQRDGRDLFADPPGAVAGFGRQEEFVRAGNWKLRRTVTDPARVQLHDLESDPGERIDRSASDPDRTESLVRELERVRRRPALARATRRPPPSDADERELRSLGYL